MKTLLEILSLKRPHGGKNERYVAEGILTRLNTETQKLQMFSNSKKEPRAYMYTTCHDSTTLFTAHLDTVHRDEDLPNPVIFDEDMGWMNKKDGTALGADDGAGVWLLYKMIQAGVPGTYLFLLGEERGGIGAKWMAENGKHHLAKFERAIAFDRRGTTDVITHQGGSRCCSQDFAQKLASSLNESLFASSTMYKPDSSGVYTDTAEFTEIIPECTNVSCGYDHEHSGAETLDVLFLEQLFAACCKVNWSALPAVRDPKVIEYDDWYGVGGANFSRRFNSTAVAGNTLLEQEETLLTFEDLAGMTDDEIDNLVYLDPESIATFLKDLRDYYYN